MHRKYSSSSMDSTAISHARFQYSSARFPRDIHMAEQAVQDHMEISTVHQNPPPPVQSAQIIRVIIDDKPVRSDPPAARNLPQSPGCSATNPETSYSGTVLPCILKDPDANSTKFSSSSCRCLVGSIIRITTFSSLPSLCYNSNRRFFLGTAAKSSASPAVSASLRFSCLKFISQPTVSVSPSVWAISIKTLI